MKPKIWQEHRTEMHQKNRRDWLQAIVYPSAVVLVVAMNMVFGR